MVLFNNIIQVFGLPDFIPRDDVANDKSGFKELSKWLKKVSNKVSLPIIVMEAQVFIMRE
mgnify:CR=1 FL=1|tara:strand:- start:2844 stop:3023 length:180 start_codon:yes stop_codon:yes gene_type:complete